MTWDWTPPWAKHIHSDIAALRAQNAQNQTVLLATINQLGDKLMSALDDLQASVAAEDTVIDSAITLIKGLADALAAAGTDPAKLAALKADIDAKAQALAAAVAANTPPPAP